MKKLENVADIYPLTPSQLGMLYHTLREPESNYYFEQVRLNLAGDLQIPLFQKAWQWVIDRHPALRTVFVWEGVDTPLQIVRENVTPTWKIEDWRSLTPEIQPTELEKLSEAFRREGFVLTRAPLLSFAAVRLTDSSTHFIWNFHHLILDGWSTTLVMDEVMAVYEALVAEQPEPEAPNPPFRSYIAWLKRQNAAEAKAYWKRQIGDVSSPTPLHVDMKTADGHFSGGQHGVFLSEDLTAQIKSFARRHRLTMNTIVQGAWGVLLNRYSGQDDVVFGVTISGRPANLAHVEDIIGMFLNTLPLRLKLTEDQPLVQWLKRVQDRQLEINQYQYSSLADIQRWSQLPGGQALFDSLLIFENYPAAPANIERTIAITDKIVAQQTDYPLTLMVGLEDKMEILALFNRFRFEPAVIERMLGHLEHIFLEFLRDPDQSVQTLDILPVPERHQVLKEWNQTAVTYPREKTLHQLFEECAKTVPDKTAVRANNSELTYDALNRKANQLAHYLRESGVGRGDFVGIGVRRSPDLLVGLLGILKAGAAYLPLDPDYPRDRLHYILEDAQANFLISQGALGQVWDGFDRTIINLDEDWPQIARFSDERPAVELCGDDLAYVIHTSGSTGRPKGVQLRHRNVVNFLTTMADKPGFSPTDTLLAVTTISFDIAVLELYLPLVTGGRVLIADETLTTDGRRLADLLHAESVTVMQATPATWKLLLNADWPGKPDLKMLCGGEELPRALAEQLLPRGRELWNMYGPTETTVWSAAKRVTSGEGPVPIGEPIANTQLYILDQRQQPTPIGVPGELCIGGDGVGAGYLNRPDLTAERFVPNPFGNSQDRSGNTLYRVGDLARYRHDGTIEFLGRIDFQVKVRGFRIELGEIEAVLERYSEIQEAVVTAQDDPSGDKRLVAYTISKNLGGNPAPIATDLREYLGQFLPPYMVPTLFVAVEEWPLTPNGKINRLALPSPQMKTTRPREEIRTALQEQMISVWETIIGIEGIGLDDNFFEIGGHSLLALRLFSRIKKEFNVNLPLSMIIESPTPRKLSIMIEPADHENGIASQSWVHVVPFGQPKSGQPVFFCVHGAGGNVVNFHDLAQQLSSQWHLVGLQASGVDGESPILTSLEEICSSYIAELKMVQPEGPYLLGGFSSGGVIAYEMAQRLEAAGDEITALVFFDTMHPSIRPRRRRIREYVTDLTQYNAAQYIIHRFKDRQRRKALERDAVTEAQKVKEAGEIVPFELRNAQLVNAIIIALRDYDPSPYQGRTIQFSATTIWWMYDQVPRDRGWRQLIPNLNVIETDGDHDTLILPPNVKGLAAKLKQALVTDLP